jgi:GMP synthase-like glutamine amidotransferase
MSRPFLILQNLHADGPGYLAQWLNARGLRYELFNTEAGQAFPSRIEPFSGMAVLGGAMSANDPLPSLRQAESLILQAVALGRPVLGHCLGGQLMARALGGEVKASPAPEIGFQPMRIQDESGATLEQAQQWFGPVREARVMHWHHEAFNLPPGAVALATSAACPVQAFALGPHLAMQFHIEVDTEKVAFWAGEHSAQWDADCIAYPSSVQSAAGIHAALAEALTHHQQMAARIYERWVRLALA